MIPFTNNGLQPPIPLEELPQELQHLRPLEKQAPDTPDQLEQPTPTPPEVNPQSYGFPQNPTTAQRHTWIRQELFLKAYAVCNRIYESAAKAGVATQTVDSWRDRDVWAFKKRFEAAEAEFIESYEEMIDSWVRNGTDKPVFYRGQQVGVIKERSELLAMFRLKKLRPEYRENYQIVVPDLTPLAVLEMMRGAGQASLKAQGKLGPVVEGEVVEKPTEKEEV